MNAKRSKTILLVLVVIWIALTVGAFTPYVILNSSRYRIIRIAILAVMMLIVVAFSCIKAVKYNKFIAWYMAVVGIVGIELFTFKAFDLNVSYNDIVLLVFTFLATCIGYKAGFDKRKIEVLTLIYGMLATALGVLTMIGFVGAIRLTNYMYVIDTKNMVGQIVATGGIGLTIVTFGRKRIQWWEIILLVFTVILIFLLRCRTAIVAFILFGALYGHRAFDSKALILSFYVVLIALLFFSSQVFSFLDTVFVGRFYVTDIESLSAGRMHRNVQGMEFFFAHPFFGEMGAHSELQNIHNYVIKRLAAYGFFSLPILAFYFWFTVKVIKEWIAADVKDYYNVGSLMMIIPFFASLLEPLSPFGPGLVQIIPFFFYGCSLRSMDDKKKPQ